MSDKNNTFQNDSLADELEFYDQAEEDLAQAYSEQDIKNLEGTQETLEDELHDIGEDSQTLGTQEEYQLPQEEKRPSFNSEQILIQDQLSRK